MDNQLEGMQTVLENEREDTKLADFKMVTFTLAGKDYGIDIMKVREISKADRFTFVPNASPFVRGVYNLRGDIISVVDMRIFFNLPIDISAVNSLQNMIILGFNDMTLGIIVDQIDKVIPIDSTDIQPPHPLFGDVNIKYINGIVENNERLYIILDVERIFLEDESVKEELSPTTPSASISVESTGRTSIAKAKSVTEDQSEDVNMQFIQETLVTFSSFYTSPVNTDWVHARFEDWKKIRKQTEGDTDLQIHSENDAEIYLKSFFSSTKGRLWMPEELDTLASLLPSDFEGMIRVWNPGCGSGLETYSLAVMMKKKYPEHQLGITGGDNDLMQISSAPTQVIPTADLPDLYVNFLVDTRAGKQFNKEIKDLIRFEFHDIKNATPHIGTHLIVARDLISFQSPEQQERILEIFYESLADGGLLLVGDHEILNHRNDFNRVETEKFHLYKKRSE